MKFNKKTVTVYCLYLVLLSYILILFFNLKSSTQTMLHDLNTITPYLKNENWEISEELFNQFDKNYTKKLENLTIINKDIEIREILLSIVDISTNIDIKNKNLCLNKLENLKFHIINLYKSQIPTLLNIF